MHAVIHRSARQLGSIAIVFLVSARVAAQAPAASAQGSPLTIRVGDAELLPGGFIDATSIRRDVNTGSGLGTSFGTIPFADTVQGHMNDTQFSSQNSRLSLVATAKTERRISRPRSKSIFSAMRQTVSMSPRTATRFACGCSGEASAAAPTNSSPASHGAS
jgi:hypothetical protein